MSIFPVPQCSSSQSTRTFHMHLLEFPEEMLIPTTSFLHVFLKAWHNKIFVVPRYSWALPPSWRGGAQTTWSRPRPPRRLWRPPRLAQRLHTRYDIEWWKPFNWSSPKSACSTFFSHISIVISCNLTNVWNKRNLCVIEAIIIAGYHHIPRECHQVVSGRLSYKTWTARNVWMVATDPLSVLLNLYLLHSAWVT